MTDAVLGQPGKAASRNQNADEMTQTVTTSGSPRQQLCARAGSNVEPALSGSRSPKSENEAPPKINILTEIVKESLNAAPEIVDEWERVIMVIDSGASAPVMPPSKGKAYPLESSEGSRRGAEYECANGAALANLGQKRMPVMTAEGTLRGYSTQCADVSKPLQSVRHLCKNHHTVVFDETGSYIHNKLTDEVNWIVDDGLNYTMEVWVVPPSQTQAMMEYATANSQAGFHRPT